MEGAAAGMVSGGRNLSAGIAGSGAEAGGAPPLRSRAAGNGGAKSAGDCGGGTQAEGMDGGEPEPVAQRGCWQSANSAAIASRNDRDAPMDCRGAGDGDLDPCGQPTLSGLPASVNQAVSIVRTDTFSGALVRVASGPVEELSGCFGPVFFGCKELDRYAGRRAQGQSLFCSG